LFSDSLFDEKLIERRWRILESRDEREGIPGVDAKPEAGGVTEIGPSFMLFKADQTNGYIVDARQSLSLSPWAFP
jgi:hypothetical protein